jgi:hypothetical protein
MRVGRIALSHPLRSIRNRHGQEDLANLRVLSFQIEDGGVFGAYEIYPCVQSIEDFGRICSAKK